MPVDAPRTPDVKIFKIFDHNWEIFSWLIPMSIFGRVVRKHFERKIRLAIETNMSRLTSQWEEAVNKSLFAMAAQAKTRLEQMVKTIEDLLSHAHNEAPEIQNALTRINDAQRTARGEATLE